MNLERTIVALAALLAPAAPAFADVLEITPSGQAIMVSGPAPSAARQPGANAPSGRLAAIAPHLNDAGARAELSPALLEAVAWTESRFNARAVSPAGAVGVMQLMPGTAAALGVDPRQPEQNVRGGAAYLRAMLEEFDGDLVLALAAYNAGPAAVHRYGGVPPYSETRAFIASVLGYMADAAAETTP
ncbi:MAG TPA: lytic transglycosylase domain-containing protein [Caulobacterales bacterium]|nr:lytic transglycosylase domain-containing protein [Caulobacterales bacterium]